MHQSQTKKLLFCRRSWMIRIIYTTSCLLRGATKGSPQLQWIWRLLQKMNRMSDAHHIFSVIENAWSKKSATSSNFFKTAPAMQKKIWTILITTKYCACHTKAMSGFILFRYENSFVLRKATIITLQPQKKSLYFIYVP